MKTAILLGGGSSVAAGFPSTGELTELVLSGHGVKRYTSGAYYISGDKPPGGTALFANCMARRLYEKVKYYYLEEEANYEDIFYLAKQASDELSGEVENPALRSFIDELRDDWLSIIEACRVAALSSIPAGDESPGDHIPSLDQFSSYLQATENPDCRDLKSLLTETSLYIADIVWQGLCRESSPEALGQLELLAYACKNLTVASISTLCHDTHVEKFLRKQGIALSDGFSEPQNGVNYWNDDFTSDKKTPFIKLHGSIDWFRFCRDGGDRYDERIGIPLNGDYDHTRTADGALQEALDGRPLLLIGTFNKISDYSSGIFLELRYRFRSTINEAEQMVICGYSFGDKGINSEIIKWYYNKRGRRFVIIHPDRDSLVANARSAIRNKWPEWERHSITFIDKQFENISIDEFMEAMHRPRSVS